MHGYAGTQAVSAAQQKPISVGLIDRIEQELVQLGEMADEIHRLTNRICGARPEAAPPPGDPVNQLNGPVAPPLVSVIGATAKVLECLRMQLGSDLKRLQEFI